MITLKSRIRVISIGLILAIVTASSLPAIAAYKPRSRRPPKHNISSAGSRNPCKGEAFTITALAPQNHIAEFARSAKQTTPLTLAWSITNLKANTKDHLEVSIYRYGETQAFVTSIPITLNADGNWTATLDRPLEVGHYAWQITSQCDQSNSLKTATGLEEFDVSELPSALECAIGNAKTPEQRSQIYAEAGFWYNALNEALLSQQAQILPALLSDLKLADKDAAK
jgi:Domain of Unknown Function (DUF928)